MGRKMCFRDRHLTELNHRIGCAWVCLHDQKSELCTCVGGVSFEGSSRIVRASGDSSFTLWSLCLGVDQRTHNHYCAEMHVMLCLPWPPAYQRAMGRLQVVVGRSDRCRGHPAWLVYRFSFVSLKKMALCRQASSEDR